MLDPDVRQGPGRGRRGGAPVRRGLLATAFVLVALLGAFVAFWHLGRQTPHTDEFTYTGAGWQYVHGLFTANLEHPPTAKYLFGAAELVLGVGVPAARLVAALASFATGLVLFVWLRRPIGPWGALLAAGWWWLTPRSDSPTWADVASGAAARIDRLALLEPVMTCFAVAAVAVAWHAATRGGPGERRWWTGTGWWALSGVLLALSVTSKVSTAVVVLAIVTLPALFRRWRAYATGGAAAVLGFAVVFVAVYLPVGGLRAIDYMLAFQSAHDTDGHEITLLGQRYELAPWWANFVRVVDGVGWPTVAVLVVGIVAALVVRPDRLVAVLAIALGSLVVFYCTSNVSLPHYYQAWMPWAIALAATGVVRTARLRPPGTTVVAVVLVAVTLLPAAVLVRTVAESRVTGFPRLAPALAAEGVPAGDRILVAGAAQASFLTFTGNRAAPAELPHGDFGVVVEATDSRFPMNPAVQRLLVDEPQRFRTFRVDFLRVWVVRGDALLHAEGDTATLVTPSGP
ncbi:hypothetical protein NS184_07435 [Curtobacterium luteum]|uniref:Glycosyltransferase RgtA/B/C/D-like domain-containing protein n=1 Tax=Curtobacterium luteum TaxID=33881 RepID=A0A175RXA8_9MICO|nr:hypothetical protein NS184_07435 [Curtobacterium luteum]